MFTVKIAEEYFSEVNFSVEEGATPLGAGDTSGTSGVITLTISIPPADATHGVSGRYNRLGPSVFKRQQVELLDSSRGVVLGEIEEARVNYGTGTIELSIQTRLGRLNISNLQVEPFSGTLEGAFTVYMAFAGIFSNFLVDPAVASRPVAYPGWGGELWYHLKLMAAAQDCDITVVGETVILRAIRTNQATLSGETDLNLSIGGGQLAEFVEIVQQNHRPIVNELVYPPGGWSESVSVISVNAGEYIEETLQLSASVVSVQQPTMTTFVSHDHSSSSVFTVSGDDGLPITPAAWAGRGGFLRVVVNPDTTSLTVQIQAPTSLPNRDGSEIRTYGIALSADTGVGRYSTLRIVGTGVISYPESVFFPTGVSESEATTCIGTTINNPFLSSASQVYRTGLRAAKRYNGTQMTLSGRFETDPLFSGPISPLADRQAFGQIAGGRIWDENSARWYRIRSAVVTPSGTQFEAEDDLICSDTDRLFSGMTVQEVEDMFSGMTYEQIAMMGVRDVV